MQIKSVVSKKNSFIVLTIAFLWGCTAPLAVITPPVYWSGTLKDRRGEVFTGVRGGVPTNLLQIPGNSWYISPFIGVGGQDEMVRGDLTLWGGYSNTYVSQFATLDTSNLKTIEQMAIHFAASGAVTSSVSPYSKLELGVSCGLGVEYNNYPHDMLIEFNSNVESPMLIATFSAFVGYTSLIDRNRLFGIRWYFIGLGTGFTISYRASNWGFWVGTQLLPIILGMPNLTIGARYHIPFR